MKDRWGGMSAKGAETLSKSEWEKLNNERSFDSAGENPL